MSLFRSVKLRRWQLLLAIVMSLTFLVAARDGAAQEPALNQEERPDQSLIGEPDLDPNRGHGARSAPEAESASRDPALRARLTALETNLMCACKDENWSKTLAHCPDRCAEPQKQEIRQLLVAYKSDREIYDFMLAKYGPKVLARPGLSGGGGASLLLLPTLLVFAGVTALIISVAVLVRRRPAPKPTANRAGDAPATSEELAKVEKELEG